MIDLSKPGMQKALAKKVKEAIDLYCETAYDGGFRSHLGGSEIGHECSRLLWYKFRWCFKEKFDGRMQRLFNRGHREEARFVEWLRGIGAEVWEFQPDGKTQFRISAVMGHFGGSLDGIVKLPPEFGFDKPMLLEFKTNGTGKGFDDLAKNGMAIAKPQHYAQTCVYGSDPAYLFEYVLYFNICKNDDNLHVEVVRLDHNHGNNMRAKAERIILAEAPPARLSDNPTFHKCNYCAAKDICHKSAIPLKNCRSCKNAKPVENVQWFCSVFNDVIPKDFIETGCADDYVPITAREV